MSIRKEVVRLLGDGFQIKESDVIQHGEPGSQVTLDDGDVRHEFFFADDRKIPDQHKAQIINSYVRNRPSGVTYP